ncbi:hypothetical protein B0H10DRAFT_1964120 [Mycena sp. CBHHK59/15]|nr:hypothetical protein B0H10DRAFT_1964120 [Mycena sp. CBHHK59/15]
MVLPGINSLPPSTWADSSQIAKETIETRVRAYNQYLARQGTTDHVPSLVDLAAEHLGDAIDEIPLPIMERALSRLFHENDNPRPWYTADRIDEWVLRNEKWLREAGDTHWEHGLVTLNDADAVFESSVLTKSARTITRPEHLPGYEVLCEARESQIDIQPSLEVFKRTFEYMSDGLLKNLDWTNLMVAGGIVLGALISVANSEGVLSPGELWKASDIDVYIYRLSPRQANQKIRHLFAMFRSNLPQGTPVLAVRNSMTITLYARYPLRRIQIVLKLVKSPKAALLNFDLDVCAVGWDRSQVWMLPRAAHALQSTYLFAHIYPSHCFRSSSWVQHLYDESNPGALLVRTSGENEDLLTLDIHFLANEARMWTLDKYFTVVSERGIDCFSPFDLDESGRRNANCLEGFTVFMRHVTYWEMKHSGAKYKWDGLYNHAEFQAHILKSNMKEVNRWVAIDRLRLEGHGFVCGDELDGAQRITCAHNLDILLESAHEIRMPVLLPCDFAIYANGLIKQALIDAGLQETNALDPAIPACSHSRRSSQETEGLYMWTITSHLMWQQVDRRIDEVFELLRAFRKANDLLSEEWQAQHLKAGLLCHESQTEVEEHEAFT